MCVAAGATPQTLPCVNRQHYCPCHCKLTLTLTCCPHLFLQSFELIPSTFLLSLLLFSCPVSMRPFDSALFFPSSMCIHSPNLIFHLMLLSFLLFTTFYCSPSSGSPSFLESTSVENIGQVIVPQETLQAGPLQTFTAMHCKSKKIEKTTAACTCVFKQTRQTSENILVQLRSMQVSIHTQPKLSVQNIFVLHDMTQWFYFEMLH